MNHFFGDDKPQEQPIGDTTPLTNVDELVLIVDRSGSMAQILDDAQGGIDQFIKEQKEAGEANLTLVEFDNQYNTVYERVPLALVPKYQLRPRGSTALLDAIGKTMNTYRDVDTTGKKIAVIVTDGQENSSIEWNRETVMKLVEDLREEDWEFVFLAADESAIQDATSWGMTMDSSIHYNSAQSGSSTAAYTAAAVYTTSLRSGKSRVDSMADMDAFVEDNATLKKLDK
jgi:hypothetical protein